MEDPEYAALQREVQEAERRAQAAPLRLWEKRGPDGWRRLGVTFAALGLGYATALSIWLLLDSVEFTRASGFGFPWEILFALAVGPGTFLFLRFSPQLRPFIRHFNRELGVGFVAGLVLTFLFLMPWI